MKVQMFESKSPFKGQQIKLGLAAVLGSAVSAGRLFPELGDKFRNRSGSGGRRISSGGLYLYFQPGQREKNYCLFYIWPSVWPLLWPRTSISAELPGSIIPNIWN